MTPKKFIIIFISWIKEIINNDGLHISIDGKAVKSARDAINGGNTSYIVSVFLSDIEISIGQVKVDNKFHEITVIPELLKLLDTQVISKILKIFYFKSFRFCWDEVRLKTLKIYDINIDS